MASGDEVKVLGFWPSPYVMRARVALNLKGVSYEFLEGVDVTLVNKSELLIESNPVYKKVPVLIHNGKPICESMIIVEYIDEVWSASGPALLPSVPYDRATARFRAFYIDDKWVPACTRIVLAQAKEAEEAEQVTAGLQLLEEVFDKCSEGKGFFGGDTIGYLDIALGCHLGWLRVAERMSGIKFLDEGKTPLLARWAERFCSDAAVKELMPETDKLVDFAKLLQARLRGASPAK